MDCLNIVTAAANSLTLSADFFVTGVCPCSCMCGKFGKGSVCEMCSCFTAVLAVKFQGACAEKPSFVRGLENSFSPSFPWQAVTCTTSNSSATCPVEVAGVHTLQCDLISLLSSKRYFKQLSDDVEAYSHHAGRKTVEMDDLEVLMRR